MIITAIKSGIAQLTAGVGKISTPVTVTVIPALTGVEVFIIPPSLTVGQTALACAFLRFSSGEVAMRTQDAAQCSAVYMTHYTALERTVAPATQSWVDAQAIVWTSLNPDIATVT